MIFYNYIKGTGSGTTNLNKGLWTWLCFQNAGSSKALSKSCTLLPEVKIADSLTGDQVPYGHIITEGASGQKITNPFTFADDLTVEGKLQVNNNIYTPKIYFQQNKKYDDDWNTPYIYSDDNYFYLNGGSTKKGTNIYHDDAIFLNTNGATLKLTQSLLELFDAPLKVDRGYVEASYFNATSDKRAKTNIQPADFNASALVEKLPIYTFDYCADMSHSLGVIAQEAMLFDGTINNFSLVDNEAATGVDGDYMTIKESKLVYILWKANQEMLRRIDSLEKQLKEKTSE